MGDNMKIYNTNCVNPYEYPKLREKKKVENKFGKPRREEGFYYYWSLPLSWGLLQRSLTNWPSPPHTHTHTHTHTHARARVPCADWAQHSTRLLLALAITVVLGFGPHWDPQPYFCSFQDHVCLNKGSPLREEGLFWAGATFVAL
jgi:hypothetical protein